ncbi:MAG TPA: homoserine dehydrogenase [Verrucomicrobiae bacterium]|nr:homoserine dehydrogenase [Verrucomicrobiae bacterium]
MGKVSQLNIGLIGAGVVGGGVVNNLTRNADVIAERLGMRLNLKWVCDKDEARLQKLHLPAELLTADAQKVLGDPDVHVVVELVGGTGFAKQVILDAFSRGKVVVTANKALLAHHGEEVFAAAEKHSTNIFYEASVCGGIPIIKAIREGFVANRFPLIYGIVNGTCNYILSRMTAEGRDFDEVLAEAQKLGYAEADPSLDVDGGDSAHKATILASLAHGFWTNLDNTYVEGIRHVSQFDIQIARELGYVIKLLAIIKTADASESAPVEVRVHPTLIPHDHVLASVNGVFNAVVVRGDVVGDTMFYGRGAGADATSSAVISDLADAALNFKFGSEQRIPAFVAHRLNARVRTIDEVESRYYLRLTVADRSGVIAKISKALGDADISIASVLQREAPETKPGQPPCDHVPLIFMLHTARDRAVREAVAIIDKLDVVKDKTVVIRVESFE